MMPEELVGKHLVLEFESVYHNAEVFLNGEKLMERPYGYTYFYVELDGHLKAGENELTVVAHNSDQPNSRWYSGTGIFRPVWLWASGEPYFVLDPAGERLQNRHPDQISPVKTSF